MRMKIIRAPFFSLRSVAAVIVGVIVVLCISFLVSFSGLLDEITIYPWSVQLAFVCIAVGIFCLSLFPTKLLYVAVFLFAAFPGRIFEEPFSLLYRIQGIWLSLFTPADILLFVLGIYSFLQLLIFHRNYSLIVKREASILTIYLLTLILSGVLNFSTSEPALFSYTLVSVVRIIVLYLTVRAFLKDAKDVKSFLLALIIGMTVQSSYSFMMFRHATLESAYSGRLGAPGLSVNSIGALAALFIPILISNIISSYAFWRRILLMFCFIVVLGVAILSLSRAGLIGIIFGSTFCIACLPSSSRRKTFIAILGLSIILFLLISQMHLQTFTRIYRIGFNEPNVLSRLNIWRDSIAMLFTHPSKLLFGYGVFGNRLAMGFTYPNFYDHAHNIFIQIFFESGTIGLALWLYMMFSILKCLIRISGINDEFLGKGLASGVFGFLMASMFDYTLWEEKVFLVFWSVIIIGIRYIEIKRFKYNVSVRGS